MQVPNDFVQWLHHILSSSDLSGIGSIAGIVSIPLSILIARNSRSRQYQAKQSKQILKKNRQQHPLDVNYQIARNRAQPSASKKITLIRDYFQKSRIEENLSGSTSSHLSPYFKKNHNTSANHQDTTANCPDAFASCVAQCTLSLPYHLLPIL